MAKTSGCDPVNRGSTPRSPFDGGREHESPSAHTSGSAADPSVESEWRAAIAAAYPQYPSIQVERVKDAGNALAAALVGVREQLRQAEAAKERWAKLSYEGRDALLDEKNRAAALRVERDAALRALKEIQSVCDTDPDAVEAATRAADIARDALAAASRSSTEPLQTPKADLGVGQKPAVVKPEEGDAT